MQWRNPLHLLAVLFPAAPPDGPLGRPQPGQRIHILYPQGGAHKINQINATAVGFGWPLMTVRYLLDEPAYVLKRKWLFGRKRLKPIYERVAAAPNVATLQPAEDKLDCQLPKELRLPFRHAHWFPFIPGQECTECDSKEIVRYTGSRVAPGVCIACNAVQPYSGVCIAVRDGENISRAKRAGN